MKLIRQLTVALLVLISLSAVGCGSSAAPFTFQAERGEGIGDVIIYVTNASDEELTNCMLTAGTERATAMTFSPRMKPGQVAMTGVSANVEKVYYGCDKYKDVVYEVPSVRDPSGSIDTANFDWAERPQFDLN